MRLSRRLLMLLLSAVLAVGLPAFAPYVMAGDEPCSMSHDSNPQEQGAADQGTNCAKHCAAVCAAMVLPAVRPLPTDLSTGCAIALLPALFQSQYGPPGLHPPR